jgi:predicted Fe-S protein YdhL (DUF1289 family)
MPASPVPSPCIDVCTLDERTGLCQGCLRHIDEIAAWGVLDDRQKREVWKLIAQRRRKLEGRALTTSPPEEPPA